MLPSSRKASHRPVLKARMLILLPLKLNAASTSTFGVNEPVSLMTELHEGLLKFEPTVG